MKTEHQFKTGEYVQLPPLEVVQDYECGDGVIWLEVGQIAQKERNIEVTHYIIPERPEKGQILVRADFVFPSPREGEYRLTVDDMRNLIEHFIDYMDKQHPKDMCYVRTGDIEESVNTWLAKRKEEV